MPTAVRLVEMSAETSFAPLGVLGYCLMRSGFLTPVWASLELAQKTVLYPPEVKLLDVLVSILAGCRALSHVDTRLRPDLALAQAWGRVSFADHSTLARTLDAFTVTQVAQLRQGIEALFRREGRVWRHDFERTWLWLDIDLTPLPISKHAEGSSKGVMDKKTAMGANWHACMPPSITRRSSHASTRVGRTVPRLTSRSSTHSKDVWG